MKPLELRIEGFGPYATRQVMDFSTLEGHDLVLIEGPTGAGKTTIFDAISYALYGHVPGARASVMGQLRSSYVEAGSEQTEVSFSFQKSAERYRVVRRPEYRRPKKRGAGFTKEPASAKLFRLCGEREHPNEELVSAKTNEISALVAELIGLSATQFNQVLVLPQGQFRDFLVAQSSQKEQLLNALFGDSVQERVSDALVAQSKHLLHESTRLREKVADRLHLGAVDSVGELQSRICGMERALPLVQADAKGARQLATALARRLGAAEEAYARTQQLKKLSDRLVALEAAWPGDPSEQVRRWSDELGQWKAQLARLERSAKLVQKGHTLHEQFERSSKAIEPLERELAGAQKTKAELETKIEQTLSQDEELSRVVEQLGDALSIRRKAQDERSAAAAIAKSLRDAQPCPVCGSLEHPAPAHGELDPQIAALDKQLRAQTKLLEDSRVLYRQHRVQLKASQTKSDRLAQTTLVAQREIEALRAQLEAVRRELTDEPDLEGVEARRRSLEEKVGNRTEQVRRAQRAVKELDEVRSSLRALSEVSTEAVEEPDLLRRAVEESERVRKAWEAHHSEVQSELSALWVIRDDVMALEREQHQVDEALRVLKPLAAAVRGQNPRGISLSRYILQAKMEEVTQAASARLLRMSDQRYRLTVGQERLRARQSAGLDLFVVDAFSGDAERPVQTLSGGEAFLASLSLAMGLSDVVQAHAGGVRMDALFIDEGFGSLDAETLDLAMSAIRELRSGGRMIGIISHVEALKEVIPAHIQVRKRPGGSVIRMPSAQGTLDTALY